MGKGLEQLFLQRKYTNGHGPYEKVLNITHHWGNANQNHNEISPYTSQNGQNQKEITSIGEDMEKKETLCTVSWYSHYGKQYGNSLKN